MRSLSGEGNLNSPLGQSEARPTDDPAADHANSNRGSARHTGDLICTHDFDGRLLSVNWESARVLGYSVEELLRVPMRELSPLEFRQEFDAYLEKIQRDGEAHGLLTIQTRSGERRVWEYYNKVRKEGVAGPVVHGMAHDVTDRRRVDRELRKTAEGFRLLEEYAPALAMFDREMRYLYVSRRWRTDYGLGDRDLSGVSHYDVFPKISDRWKELHRRGLAGEVLREEHDRFDGIDGSTQWVRWEIRPWHETTGEVGGIVVFSEDITDLTERKRAEEALRESEAQLRLAQEAAKIGAFERDLRTGEIRWSPQMGALFGLDPGQYPRTLAELLEHVHPDDRSYLSGRIEESIQTGNADGEWRVVWPDRSVHWIGGRWHAFKDEEGKPVRILGMDFDITEGKHAEEALRISEAELKEAQRVALMGSWHLDLKTLAIHWSEQINRTLGVDPQTPAPNFANLTSLLTAEGWSLAKRAVDSIIRTGRPQEIEAEFRRADGTTGWGRLRGEPDCDASGNVTALHGIAIDITEGKRAEEALRLREAELKEAQSVARMGSWRLNLKTQTITASEELFRVVGLPGISPQMAFSDLADILPPESWHRVVRSHEEALRSGQTEELELAFYRCDGSLGWLLVRSKPELDETGTLTGMRGIAIDITERKRIEEALAASEERMRLAQQAANIGIFERNMQTGGSRWSPEMEGIFGLAPGMAPKTVEALMQLVHPEDREHLEQLVADSIAAGTGGGEWRVIWPDGSLHWVSGRWRMFKDDRGRPLRALGVDIDITERKRIEEELRQAKEKLTEEKLYLEHSIDSEMGFEEIIGKSPGLKAVMALVAKVASSDATVLLLGETGVGKELVARAIHRLSLRTGNAFIKTNCAAIPTGLLESELFGAEKGAYTGSVSRKIGRLELADKGTLFLDEIGDIALALQPKLLRVLQDQEFERLGGTQTLKVDFRLIAATNRDLAEEVKHNQFRSDLYYRLNVFPIHIPPLRERREDIRPLVEYFVQKCAKRLNKSITSIPKRTMAALTAWDWPGNVRELENFIERSVILTNGSALASPLSELQARLSVADRAETLEAAERKHILEALRQSKGRISGEHGAAARLGLKRTTLQSKLKQLRINPRTPPAN